MLNLSIDDAECAVNSSISSDSKDFYLNLSVMSPHIFRCSHFLLIINRFWYKIAIPILYWFFRLHFELSSKGDGNCNSTIILEIQNNKNVSWFWWDKMVQCFCRAGSVARVQCVDGRTVSNHKIDEKLTLLSWKI